MGTKSPLHTALAPESAAPVLFLLPLILVLAPHALHLPLWISLSWLAYAGLNLARAYTGWRGPGRLLLAVLALAGVAGVFLQYRSVIGPVAGVALLIYLSGAKLLETQTPRDRLNLLFVGCFLLVAWFLKEQALTSAAYMTLAALALVAGMVATQGAAGWRTPLTVAARLMVQALPLALLMFLLFPRIHGPLWSLPQADVGRTGLSDRMRPGDISRLIQSDELAFRAEFKGRQPTPQQLYWRGPVLWDFDGRTWLTHTPPAAAPLDGAGIGEPLSYRLTLEPQRQPWLLLLGLPKRLPPLPGAQLGPDLQWRTQDPIDRRLQYEVEAWPDYRLQTDHPPGPRALALPAEGDPQARALAQQWRAQTGNDAAIVTRALSLFRQEPFHYTLKPPPLGVDAVDGFLFTSRRGFCEHYAGAFVFLMRAAGVPARVVTGYQGGEKNPLGGHYVIRGRDAHAWAEVWLAGRGWVRVDPTAAVAPSRVERGIAEALPAGEHRLVDAGWLLPLRLTWDLVNNQWNTWVLGYDDARQRRLLQRLSPYLGDWRGMATALAVAAAVMLLAAALFLLPKRPRRDVATRLYQRYCRRLGLPRGAAEAPEDHARRAAAHFPSDAAAIQSITRLYLACRYGPADATAQKQLRAAVAAFRRRAAPRTT